MARRAGQLREWLQVRKGLKERSRKGLQERSRKGLQEPREDGWRARGGGPPDFFARGTRAKSTVDCQGGRAKSTVDFSLEHAKSTDDFPAGKSTVDFSGGPREAQRHEDCRAKSNMERDLNKNFSGNEV